MKNIATSPKIYIKDSIVTKNERGVFALSDIKKGELIETCPIIEIPENDPSNPTEGTLIQYIYYFGKSKNKQLLALGFGSIYNHTRIPNAIYKIKEKEAIIEFIASKDINKDEEITVNYNYLLNDSKTPLWCE